MKQGEIEFTVYNKELRQVVNVIAKTAREAVVKSTGDEHCRSCCRWCYTYRVETNDERFFYFT